MAFPDGDSDERCRGFLDYFCGPDAPKDWIAGFLALDDQVGAEDTALVDAAQRGAASRLVGERTPGRLRRAADRAPPGLRARRPHLNGARHPLGWPLPKEEPSLFI